MNVGGFSGKVFSFAKAVFIFAVNNHAATPLAQNLLQVLIVFNEQGACGASHKYFYARRVGCLFQGC